MAVNQLLFLVATTLLLQAGHGLPENRTDSLVNAAIDAGTFQNPSKQVRPKWRYWVPDASVDNATLAADITAVKAGGAAGVEIIGYYSYGGNGGAGNSTPDDWTVYGWGLPAWKEKFYTLLEATQENDLIVDFALGPNQGQGVPSPENADGLAWDLYPFNITVPLGGSFNDIIPGWGTGQLHSVTTALATDSVDVTVPASQPLSLVENGTLPSLPNDEPFNRTQITLSSESLTVVTDQVGSDGSLNITFPSASTGLHYTIFVTYLIHTGYRAQNPASEMVGPFPTPAQTWQQNGSWAVDHYSTTGADTVTSFWNTYLLDNATKTLLGSVGNYGWEDSIELRSNIQWTQNYSTSFTAGHGYDIEKYLPIIFHQQHINLFSAEPSVWFVTDEVDAGNSHIADYRQTLTDLYRSYLTTLKQWANDELDVQLSAQVAYNLPMDVLADVPYVDAPELESLGFNHLIDGYRQYCGPANLASKRLVSTEIGANFGKAYQLTLPELLWDVKRSFAGGVTEFVFHGLPFSGIYGETTWPGFTTFTYLFSEMHGPRQPGWDFYKDSLMDFTARNSYIFQSGVPKMDLAFYSKLTTYPQIVRSYQPIDLESAGFTYEYLSPDNFDLQNAVVSDGILAANAQAFKALVVRGNDTMTVQGAAGIADFAHAGLPIIFSGGIPSYVASYNANGSAYVNETLQSLTDLSNVHVVPYDDLASTVASLSIQPLTSVNANGSWFTYWRRDDVNGIDYIFVYNDEPSYVPGEAYTEGTIEFASIGTPYFFDAWTGEQSRIQNFTSSTNSTTIPLHLAGTQSVIIAFADNSTRIFCNTSSTISDPSVPLPSAVSTYDLSNWTLTVEHWDPPANLSADVTPSGTVKSNTTHQLTSLVSWQNITGLQNVSGRGYYSTTFDWPPLATHHSARVPSRLGAYIDFGAIVHTISVRINGQQLAPLDPTWAKTDISQYLTNGANTVEAVVSTPLFNVLKPIWSQLKSSGESPAMPVSDIPSQDYGLLLPVTVTAFEKRGRHGYEREI